MLKKVASLRLRVKLQKFVQRAMPPDSTSINQIFELPMLYFIWPYSPASIYNHIRLIEVLVKVEMGKLRH